MKKLIYYLCLFLSWFAMLHVFAFFLVIIGVNRFTISWGYTMGGSIMTPCLLMLCAGLAMLTRGFWHKEIFKDKKVFDNSLAYVLIIGGTIWTLGYVGVKLLNNYAHDKSTEMLEEYIYH